MIVAEKMGQSKSVVKTVAKVVSDGCGGFIAFIIQTSRTGIDNEVAEDVLASKNFRRESSAKKWAQENL